MFKIFTFLTIPELALSSEVCSRWRFLCSDPVLWRSIDVSKIPLPEHVVDKLVQRHGRHTIDAKFCSAKISSSSFSSMAPQLSRLRSLHLCAAEGVDDAAVKAFSSRASSLQSVVLDDCRDVSDAGISSLFLNLPQLHTLSIRHCEKVTDKAFTEARSLRSLNVAGCNKIVVTSLSATLAEHSGHTLTHLDLHGLALLDSSIDPLSNCSELEELRLSSSNSFHGGMLTDHSVRTIAHLTKLHTLDLQGNNSLTDQFVSQLASACTALTTLNLGGCSLISDHAARTLAQSARKLDSLNLFQCTRLSLNAVVYLGYLPRLRRLDLHSCFRIRGKVATAFLRPTSYPALQELNLGSLEQKIRPGQLDLVRDQRPHWEITSY